MFYSEYVLARKGALGKVWLAAHWEKKLSRTQMARSNIVDACNSIMKPTAPLALRTSGHLLLGVVRIHDGKQHSLMHDCSDALVKIKLAFRPGNVDLPSDEISAGANTSAITMTETFVDFENDFPDANGLSGAALEDDDGSMNIGTAEEITMTENDLSGYDVMAPEMAGFGDVGFPGAVSTPFDDTVISSVEVGRERDDQDQSFQIDLADGAMDHLESDLSKQVDTTHDDIGEIPMDTNDISAIGLNDFGDISAVPAEMPDNSLMPDVADTSAMTEDGSAIMPASRGPTPFGDLTSLAPADDMKNASGPVAKPGRRKRKMVVDMSLEISSTAMRKALEPHGPDDITRQPFRKKRGPFDYDRLPYSDEGHTIAMEDMSVEALFSKVHIPGVRGALAPELEHVLTRYLTTESRTDILDESGEKEAEVAEVEIGRKAAEEQDEFDLQAMDDLPANVLDASRDISTFEPEPIPDDPLLQLDESTSIDPSVNGTFDLDTADLSISVNEEFDEQHLTKRSQKMIQNLKSKFEGEDELSFKSMAAGMNRRKAAAVLFEVLVLKTKDYIEVEQTEPYGDITLTATNQLLTAE